MSNIKDEKLECFKCRKDCEKEFMGRNYLVAEMIENIRSKSKKKRSVSADVDNCSKEKPMQAQFQQIEEIKEERLEDIICPF